MLELGAGAGFLADFVPGLLRSEVFYTPGLELCSTAWRCRSPPARCGGSR